MKQTMTATSASFGQGLGFSPKRSPAPMVAPGGSLAMPVRDAPNGTFNLAFAFTAQPLASRMGPRLRLRSFSQAISIEGPEITNSNPMIAKHNCQNGKWNNPVAYPNNEVTNAPIPAMATLMAAT